MGYQGEPKDMIREFYVLPAYRGSALPMFRLLIVGSKARRITAQSNDVLLTLLLYDCAEEITSETVIFNDVVTTNLAITGATSRQVTEVDKERIFEHKAEPVGEWLIEHDGAIVATGGIATHYNPPYGDLFMEVNEPFRRRGMELPDPRIETDLLRDRPCPGGSMQRLERRLPGDFAKGGAFAVCRLLSGVLSPERISNQSRSPISQGIFFRAVGAIGNTDTDALPVKQIGPAVGYFTQCLGFSLVSKDRTSASSSGTTCRSVWQSVATIRSRQVAGSPLVMWTPCGASWMPRGSSRGLSMSRYTTARATASSSQRSPTGSASASPIPWNKRGAPEVTHEASELKFVATPEKGDVSALRVQPSNASHVLVLGHGASTNMRHANLQTIAERLAEVRIETFRYNFPYMEHGKGRDSQAVCTHTVRSAVTAAREAAPGLPILAGGHSFGGRMTSTAAAELPLEGVRGLVFFAYPLHQPGKPDTKRADHLDAVKIPMLFLSERW